MSNWQFHSVCSKSLTYGTQRTTVQSTENWRNTPVTVATNQQYKIKM